MLLKNKDGANPKVIRTILKHFVKWSKINTWDISPHVTERPKEEFVLVQVEKPPFWHLRTQIKETGARMRFDLFRSY